MLTVWKISNEIQQLALSPILEEPIVIGQDVFKADPRALESLRSRFGYLRVFPLFEDGLIGFSADSPVTNVFKMFAASYWEPKWVFVGQMLEG